MLTDVLAYCVTFFIYLFQSPLTVAAIYRKQRKKTCTPNIITDEIASAVKPEKITI